MRCQSSDCEDSTWGSAVWSFAVIVAICVTSHAAKAGDDPPADNLWVGTMDAGSRLFRFRIEPTIDANGSASQQLVSLDEGNQVFRLDDFKLDDTQLAFTLRATKANYAGEISESGKVSTGKWEQKGKVFDLVFRKVASEPVDPPSEIWSGTLNTLLQKLALRVRVYHRQDGAEEIYFDSVSQKASGFKAIRTKDNDQWTIEVASLGGTFKGVINNDKSAVTGKWTQAGVEFDLTLTPQESATEVLAGVPNRPQTPTAPFPYSVEEVEFRNEADDVQLAGTLTVPETDRPCPAVIMISGSGPQDRDETLFEHRPFWVIADHLSRHGIAALRYDDRGTGASNGNFSNATSQDFSKDVEAAFDHLKKDPRIAAKMVGLIGHSEGGLIAPMIAARRNDVAFVVLLAGTGVNGREILLSQGQSVLRAEGVMEENLLNIQRETQLALIDTLLAATPGATTESLVDTTMKKLSKTLPDDSQDGESLKALVTAGINRMRTPWFHFFLTHEPASQLQLVKCPVLALNGEKDVQVVPELNLPAIQAALEKGGNTNFRTIQFPAINHLFQTCTTGGPSEYQTIEETISPIVLQTITDWIKDVSLYTSTR